MYLFSFTEEDGIFRYAFFNKRGVPYSVYFATASEYFDRFILPVSLKESGFSFGIARLVDDESIVYSFDKDIKVTIGSIASDFFKKSPGAILLIHYDNYDGKEEKRYKCFDRWFNELNTELRFCKEDILLEIPGSKIYISIVFSIQHQDKKAIMKDFFQVGETLLKEK